VCGLYARFGLSRDHRENPMRNIQLVRKTLQKRFMFRFEAGKPLAAHRRANGAGRADEPPPRSAREADRHIEREALDCLKSADLKIPQDLSVDAGAVCVPPPAAVLEHQLLGCFGGGSRKRYVSLVNDRHLPGPAEHAVDFKRREGPIKPMPAL